MPPKNPTKYQAEKLRQLLLDDVFKQYAAELRQLNLSENTLFAYERTLRRFSRWYAEAHGTRPIRMQDVTPQVAGEYVGHRLQLKTVYEHHPYHAPQERKLSPYTVHQDVRGLKAFGTWLTNKGYDNPFGELKRPKLHKRQIGVLLPNEIERLFACRNPNTPVGARSNAMVAVAVDSGVRVSELVGLTLLRLDLDRRRAQVIGKGNEERRIIFGDRSFLALTHYINLFRARDKGAETVFTALDGMPLTVTGAEQILQELKRAADVPRLHWHLLRHTFATYFLATEQGDLKRLQELMGHKDIRTTMRYVHMSEQLRDELGLLAGGRPVRPTLLDALGVSTTPRGRGNRRPPASDGFAKP